VLEYLLGRRVMTITHSREAAVVPYAPSAVDSNAPNETETGVLGVSVEVGPSSQSWRRDAVDLCAKETPMSEDTGFQFTDAAVPRAYEEVLVPRLFEPWALLLLDECNIRPNAVVLDVATNPFSKSGRRESATHAHRGG
jgi:hypothetical protein